MNRAVFHRLGLSVGIAIALSGCEATQRRDAYRACLEYADAHKLPADKAISECNSLMDGAK